MTRLGKFIILCLALTAAISSFQGIAFAEHHHGSEQVVEHPNHDGEGHHHGHHHNNGNDHAHDHHDHDHSHDEEHSQDEHHHSHEKEHSHDHHGHHHGHEEEHSHDHHGHHHGHEEEHSHDHHGHHHNHAEGHSHDHDHNGHHHNHGKEHSHDHHDHSKAHSTKNLDGRTDNQIWFEAFAGTALITLGGNAAILAFVVMDISKGFLNVMVAFAVGGLLGDVFLHLIPHAMEAQENASGGHHHHHHGDDHHHEHDLTVGLCLLAGIVTFFIVEKTLNNSHGHGKHGHSHSLSEDAKRKKDDDYKPEEDSKKSGLRKRSVKTKESDVDEKEPDDVTTTSASFSAKAILHMVADAVHNFTDGMAIAAAFQVSYAVGQTMTVAVLFHEIPHEFGDFAVLISQGFSKKGAFLAQFVSAIGAFLGCLFGLAISSEQPAAILSFTGGGFIYIALANIVPDLMQGSEGAFRQTFAELVAMLVGIGMMVLIAKYEPHM